MKKESIIERVRGGGMSGAIKPFPKPTGSGGSGGRNNPGGSTTPIRKIDPKQFDNRSASVTTNTPSGGSLKAGSFGISQAGKQQAAANRAEFKAKADAVKSTSTTSSDTSSSSMSPRDKFKSKFIKKDKGVGFVKRGTPGAQRAENKEKARLRAQAMAKARIEAKKKAAEMANEEITPYDMVLEYLLSTEQAATIEEANYVMMQLDEENIQEIVGQVAKVIMKTPLVKLVPAAAATVVGTKMIASRMGKKSGENEIQKSTTPVPMGDEKKKKKGNFITNFINKKRDEKGGGNYRVDEVEKKANVKSGFAGEKIKF